MTRDEIKNTPEIVDFMLDKSVIADSRMKLHKRLEEICELAINDLNQEPILDKIRAIVDEWQSDTWTDNLSYEYMVKIAELVELQESEE